MAFSENIKTGKYYRILIDAVNNVYDRISFWSKASDCEFNDGRNAESKVGAINGITSSLVSTDPNVALSAQAGAQINSKLGGNSLTYENGNYYIQAGADSGTKKLLGKPSYVDVSISGWGTYSLSNYVSGNHEIIGAGMVYRDYYGWIGFRITYTATTFTITNLGDSGGTDPHYASIRVWYL